MSTQEKQVAFGRLRQAKARLQSSGSMQTVAESRGEVYARYSPMFQPDKVRSIGEEALRSFFYYENNKHWTSLFRQVNRICGDMPLARKSLALLMDETNPIATRLPKVIRSIKGMGPGIATAFLHVAYPGRYGVWNKTSETGMLALDLMPSLPRGSDAGEKYTRMNAVFLELAEELSVDLWTLDTLWWNLDIEGNADGVRPATTENETDAERPTSPAPLEAEGVSVFGLERHLHDFMHDNWNATSLGQEWDLFTRDGEPDAGYEFPTSVGRIDLLARHRSDPRWLVIELKRDRTSDRVIGQVLRYMGWVHENLAESGETVEGMVVARQGDRALHYAISAVPGLSFMTYQVDFRLTPARTSGGAEGE